MTVGYRFCGSCNPHIDTVALLKRLEKADPETRYVYWEHGGFDKLLIISGCPRDCTTRPEFAGETVAVAGASLAGVAVKEEALTAAVLKALHEK